jgi:hypothetical protein
VCFRTWTPILNLTYVFCTRVGRPRESPITASKVVMMRDSKQAERIRSLIESFPEDQAERKRLKQQSDEALAQFRRAVREFVDESRRARRRLRD